MRIKNLFAIGLVALASLTPRASATWSVVLVNADTGEVIIASATCLANFDLEIGLPVVRVGQGAAAAQSFVDVSGANRQLIWDALGSDTPPQQILQLLAAADPQHQTRQYAIADTDNKPAGFTGNQAGPAKKKVTGIDGPWRYAIAGNVLTSQQVIDDALAALLSEGGDGSQKVMAAMEAARALGGDGRCSCALFDPTGCGAPPAGGFDKSAHVGFLIVARLGDTDGVCNADQGCANGDYFLNLNVVGAISDPDPVLTLQSMYAAWRASRSGKPDHYASSVQAAAERLVADGSSSTEVTISLADIDGVPLATGGLSVSVAQVDPDGASSSAGPVTDNGDGSYSFVLTATTAPGLDRFEVSVSDGADTVLLWPPLELTVDPLVELHSGQTGASAALGAEVPLTLNVPAPGAGYFVLASLSGTSPGVALSGGVLPLNPDGLFYASLSAPNGPLFQQTLGVLDSAGRASAAVLVPAGLAPSAVGLRVDLAAVIAAGSLTATNAAGFDILP
jgi:hypothetical protein